MKKLAIISSYNESCGNASYTHVLKGAFAEHVEVEVIALDLFLLQKKGKFYDSHGDRHIDEIATRLADFDYVNIQFEAGLYGSSPGTVYRRISKLIKAAGSLVFTMHRVDPPEMTRYELLRQVIKLKMYPSAAIKANNRGRYARLYESIIRLCAAEGVRKPLQIAVHTKREYRIIKDLYGVSNVFFYPITFLNAEERRTIQASTDIATFRQRHQVPDGVKVIGAFGFVSRYKGYDTLLKALTVLPPDHHLYIFGGQHPQSLKTNLPLDPYLEELFGIIRGEEKDLAEHRASHRGAQPKDSVSNSALHKNLTDRVHFIGSLDDPQFIEALRFSDFTVLPYMEVGQSMSGVITLAIESGANLFCTNNHSFNEARKILGDVYQTFDVGNYMELAEKLRKAPQDYTAQRDKAYANYNIRGNVHRHLEAFGHGFDA